MEITSSGYRFQKTQAEFLFALLDPDDPTAVNYIESKLSDGWGLVDLFQMLSEFKAGTLGGTGVIDPAQLDHELLQNRDSATAHTQYALASSLASVSAAAAAAGVDADAALAQLASLTAAAVAETTSRKWMTDAERTKLTGIAAEATKNDTDANLKDRSKHTGTQSADTLTDSLGTDPTSGRKFTKGLKDKLDGLSASAGVPQATFDAHKSATSGTEHDAGAIEFPAYDVTEDVTVFSNAPDAYSVSFDMLSSATGQPLADWLVTFLTAAGLDSLLNEVHRNQTSTAHGLPETSRILSADSRGVYRINKATAPPAAGTNPPADTAEFWMNAKGFVFRNEDGQEIQVLPTWKNEFILLEADSAGKLNATMADLASTTNDLVAPAKYWVEGMLRVTAGGGATGGVKLGWSGPTGAQFNWAALMPAPGANSVTAETQWKSTTIGGTISGGGVDTGDVFTVQVKGLWTQGATAGKPTLRYAQATTDAAAPTVIKSDSFLVWTRLA